MEPNGIPRTVPVSGGTAYRQSGAIPSGPSASIGGCHIAAPLLRPLRCGGRAPAGVPRVGVPAGVGRAYGGGVQPAQRVTLVVVLLISALLGAYVWTGWVHAENGLVTFLGTVLVVVAVGLLAGFQAARREGRKVRR